MHRLPGALAAVAALILFFPLTSAYAQGLDDATSGVVGPLPQAAAVDDGFAQWTNPAGLAYVDALQLVGAYSGHLGALPRDAYLGQVSLSLWDGFVLSTGGGLHLRPIAQAPSYGHWNASAAWRMDRLFSLGASWSRVSTGDPNDDVIEHTTLGAQLRPASWLSLGAVMEGLGARDNGLLANDIRGIRLGISTRPLGDGWTLGLDVRARPGANSWLQSAAFEDATWTSALHTTIRLGGFALTGGASLRSLSFAGTPDVQFGIGIQTDTRHFGVAASGGSDTNQQHLAQVFGRASLESFPTLFPAGEDWVKLTLVGDGVPAQNPNDLLERFFAPDISPTTVLATLERAAEDPGIGGVVLRVRNLSLGWGRLAEFRALLQHLRARGKRSIVYLETASDGDIYLASAADRVLLSPAGGVDLNGLQLVMTYYGSGLRRVGIQAEAISAGEFKNAPKTFLADEPSEAELLVENAILDGIFADMVSGIATGRNLATDEVEDLIDKGGLTAAEALEAKLVDGVMHWDQIREHIQEWTGKRPWFDESYLEQSRVLTSWQEPKRIAVIPIEGVIQMGRSGGGMFGTGEQSVGADDIVEALEAAANDSNVVAVVLRINSPGGDALASDLIWRAAMRAREEKPVVASMGDVAASGGYYIAAGAQEIFAENNTLTGSIGVYSLYFHVEELLSDLGISTFELSRGALPGPTLYRAPSTEERKRIQDLVDNTYERFLTAIRTGRDIEEDALREVAEGRVWLGADALKHRLVDHLGGLNAALKRAKELAGLDAAERPEISILNHGNETLPRIRTAVQAWMGLSPSAAEIQALRSLFLGHDADFALLRMQNRPLALPRNQIVIE